MAFTVAVIANIVVMGRGQLAVWVGLLTLLPLALLLLTGLYLFALPYATRWRSERVPFGIQEGDNNHEEAEDRRQGRVTSRIKSAA